MCLVLIEWDPMIVSAYFSCWNRIAISILFNIENGDGTKSLPHGHLYSSLYSYFFDQSNVSYFSGKIIRLVQEKYLRADVECGYLFGRILSQVSHIQ